MSQHNSMNPASHQKTVLVVEDNELNREILTGILEEDGYQVLTAENGFEGIAVLSDHVHELSLVILDLFMPECDGFTFLEKVREDAMLAAVPVIVATGSNSEEDEIRCLDLGAVDFVSKPYNPRVVLARARSSIRLRESTDALDAVEHEKKTGLYMLQAFGHHMERVLKSNPSVSFDLTVVQCCDLLLINRSMGTGKGDEVLKYIAGICTEQFPEALVGRKGDKFYLFYPSEHSPTPEGGRAFILQAIQAAPIPNIRIKAGFYENVDHSIPVDEIIDRALMALNTIRDGFSTIVAGYNETLQSRQYLERQMEAGFENAIATEEFKVWYQPKVNVQTGEVAGAEALVRWITPEGRMISPGMFIPLFEEDGLIRRLDEYVFRKVCQFQHERLASGLPAVPISVNLSRNSMYHDEVLQRYLGILDEYQVPIHLVPIELTESAMMADNRTDLRMQEYTDAGFKLHMDDFGTGYSSIASLISLPFSVLKIDKSIVDQTKSSKGQMMMKHIIQIAHEIHVNVVAEGVETAEQVECLRSIDCDMIQGYYYYKPMDGESFRKLL